MLTATVTAPLTATSTLRFQPLKVADAVALRPLLQRQPWRTCDFTVGGLGLWADWFRYNYAITPEGSLLIEGASEANPGFRAFAMPLAADGGAADIARLLQLSRAHGSGELRLSAVPEPALDVLMQFAPRSIEELPAWNDYLYDIEAIATLRGRHYNKKRNHVNRFMADHPGARLAPLEGDMITRACRFVEELPPTSTAPMALYERNRALQALAALPDWGFEGAALLTGSDADAEIAAITFGEIIGDTLHVHVEKINHAIAGAGETLSSMFAAMMLERHPGVAFTNRQDDAGDPGLREAKLSWRPTDVLKKFEVVI